MGVIDRKRVGLTISNPYLEGMDLLIKDGLYECQSEVVKDALRRLFSHYKISLVNLTEVDSGNIT